MRSSYEASDLCFSLQKCPLYRILQKTGSRQGQIAFDNESLSNATIDLREYITHKCFHIAGNERAECTKRFGPFADLQKTLLDGALIGLVREKYPDKENLRTLLTAVRKTQRMLKQQKLDRPVKTAQGITNTTLHTNRLDRRQAVWDICKNRYGTNVHGATLCFLRNHRIITSLSIPLSADLVY
ncbi:hypothetical protein COU76_03325 [Candidatus Peregrinibacteria bacterium CG10_big_fil_rev_8_21_14_0_10_49_10]|nr:MAG: hypothetical protein COU76_03325 [Candidatus Peregrinibacteria bacterium CG10_big_fil_rev_8_21_14_0_10_49_10]